MRVIAGSAKRIQLKTIEGLETRPTTDRIKPLASRRSAEARGRRYLSRKAGRRPE